MSLADCTVHVTDHAAIRFAERAMRVRCTPATAIPHVTDAVRRATRATKAHKRHIRATCPDRGVQEYEAGGWVYWYDVHTALIYVTQNVGVNTYRVVTCIPYA
jgi:hypothetical protein